MNIKSPLRYPGGKSKAVKILYPLICDCDTFYEPFAGGSSLGLYVSQAKNIPVYLNDINYDVYSFWLSALKTNNDLVKNVLTYFDKPKSFATYQEVLNWKTSNELETGTRFFCLNRMSFSGTVEAGGYSNSAHLQRFTLSSVKKLEAVKNLKNNISVFNDDYKDFLLNNLGNNPFVFLDPPYFSNKKSALYGKNGKLHKQFDHDELFTFLLENKSRFSFFMTYDNSEYIKNKYIKDFYVYQWSLQYGMTNKKSAKNNELLISNYLLKENNLVSRIVG